MLIYTCKLVYKLLIFLLVMQQLYKIAKGKKYKRILFVALFSKNKIFYP